MDVREKLLELIESARYLGSNTSEEIADHLIKNGVTVQEWISVDDRLPEDMGDVLVTAFWHETWGAQVGWYSQINKIWHIITPQGDVGWVKVSHWMPLPQPPKGE